MTRYGYDSVTPSNIPTDAPVVFGYVDGHYAWSAGDWARFTTRTKIRIAVFPGTNDGHVLDCEPGDAVPSQCPGWVKMRRNAGIDPTVYTSLGEWGQVIDAFNSAGVAQPHYWIAAYPGAGEVQQTLRGLTSIAHQFTDTGAYDKSVVIDVWPGVDHFTPNIIMEVPDMWAPFANPSGWLLYVSEDYRVEDTQQKVPAGATWNGLPIPVLTAEREAALRALQATREDQINNPQSAQVTFNNAQLALDFPKNWKVVQADAVTTTVTGQ